MSAMNPESGTLPLRKDGRIDTRPLEIEEWLEVLPYADFKRTSSLLHDALSATNKTPLKPGVRRELLGLYHQPYQYYLDTQIRAGSQHTLQTIETMQQQLRMMKQLAADLALAARLAVDDSMSRKSLWGQNRFQVDMLQRAMSYLSHALIFTFLEYAPTPRNVWKQLNAFYKLAEDLGQQHAQVPVAGNDNQRTTVEHTYNRIVLAEAVDPYRLPFGAIWEIYEQLDEWIERTRLQPFEPVNRPDGLFVIDLGSDTQPVHYAMFSGGKAGPQHRILDASELEPLIRQHQEKIQSGSQIHDLRLSAAHAGKLLAHMMRAWTLPPKRYFPREAGAGKVKITCGMNPVHYHMNQGRDYLQELGNDAMRPSVDGLDVSGDDTDDIMDMTTSDYMIDQWDIANAGPGGYALVKKSRPACTTRVGDLIGVHNPEQDNGWSLGVIRWLMADERGGYRLGVQLLARNAEPVAVRPVRGNQTKGLQRAFLIDKPGEMVLVTTAGFYHRQRDIELVRGGERQQLQTGRLQEAAIGFEQFELDS